MSTAIKVSVLCLSYNQAKYIGQCIESILAQKTSFDIELLINDDASTDGTRDIIKEYQRRYPKIIKTILHEENQYSQGKRNFLVRFLLPISRGEYIAICEGDDYWTDPTKLQKQVDFMDKHPDYAVCFHKVQVVYEKGGKPDQIYPDVDDVKWYTHKQLFDINYIQTNSVMYRKQSYADTPVNGMPTDWFMHLYHASFGKIKLIDEVMSVYRKHAEGMWWDYDRDRESIWRKHGVAHLSMWINLYSLYSTKPVYLSPIKRHITEMINTLLRLDNKYGDNNFIEAITQYPDQVRSNLLRQATDLANKREELQQLSNELIAKEVEIAGLTNALNNKEQELLRITSTKTWRLRQSMRKTAKNVTIRKNQSA